MLKWQCWQSSSSLGSKERPQFWHTGPSILGMKLEPKRSIKTMKQKIPDNTTAKRITTVSQGLGLRILCDSVMSLSVLSMSGFFE